MLAVSHQQPRQRPRTPVVGWGPPPEHHAGRSWRNLAGWAIVCALFGPAAVLGVYLAAAAISRAGRSGEPARLAWWALTASVIGVIYFSAAVVVIST